MKYITTIGEREFMVEVLEDGQVTIDGKPYRVNLAEIGEGRVYSLIIEGKSVEAYVYPSEDGWQVLYQGRFYPAKVEDERERRVRQAAGGDGPEHAEYILKSPMPGLVVAVPVEDGQQVAKGDVLIVLESMKMQNELKAPRAGTVTRVRVQAGERVEQQSPLLTVTG
jgi:biotin carboxyl carrier protein